jgi:predicted GNAT superfamily acetyltransferase
MRDGLNVGLASDRFEVDWWVNSKRVEKRLSTKARPNLDLSHFLAADAAIINPTQVDNQGWVIATKSASSTPENFFKDPIPIIVLVEIPSDFLALKHANFESAREWRMTTRSIFENLFQRGYLVTDFVYLPGKFPRSYYVFSHGEGTL